MMFTVIYFLYEIGFFDNSVFIFELMTGFIQVLNFIVFVFVVVVVAVVIVVVVVFVVVVVVVVVVVRVGKG